METISVRLAYQKRFYKYIAQRRYIENGSLQLLFYTYYKRLRSFSGR
jgi:hypothetical protein